MWESQLCAAVPAQLNPTLYVLPLHPVVMVQPPNIFSLYLAHQQINKLPSRTAVMLIKKYGQMGTGAMVHF